MSLCPIETLQRLVQTPSVNPMGRDIVGPGIGEGRMTDLLVEICRSQGWSWSRQPVHAGRDNLLVTIEGHPAPQQGGELLLWDVHQDTVPTDGMTVDPFGGELRNGRVYGRGACDVKGSMAAMLAALSRVSPRRTSPRPTILLACTVNEECGFTGARALCATWHQAPDAAIVAEPTGLNVIVAHQGVVRWRVHTLGRAAHSSRPDEGVNAIYPMARVVQALEQVHRQLAATTVCHPLCGRASLCVSTIHGGAGVNTVPDRATIEIDRRLSPGESADDAVRAVIHCLAASVEPGGCQLVHDPPFMQSPGMSDEHNRPLAQRLSRVVAEFGLESRLTGAPYGTDGAALAAAGVPTVVFGPGSVAQAHTADEFIEVNQLQAATEIFQQIAQRGLR